MFKKQKNNLKTEILGVAENKNKKSSKWVVYIFILSLCLSVLFAVISEFMLMYANLALALILILVLIAVSVLFDVIGVAVAASDIRPFLDMKNKNERGAKEAVYLIKKADRVSTICTDVIGDISSILSGAAGASIALIIMGRVESFNGPLLSIIISAVIAALTILGKALGKSYALNYSNVVMLKVGKFVSIFTKRRTKNE